MHRRNFFKFAVSIAPAACLLSQAAPQPPIVLTVSITDRQNRHVLGLTASDFRLFEDGIPQKIASLTHPNGSAGPQPDRERRGVSNPRSGAEAFESFRGALENSYTITYHPDPSNKNQGFRKITLEVVSDPAGNWRVRHRPGYRPEK